VPDKLGPVDTLRMAGLWALRLRHRALAGEAHILLIPSETLVRGHHLPADDLDRLRMSVSRIRAATAHV